MQHLTRFTSYKTPEEVLGSIFIFRVKFWIFVHRNPISSAALAGLLTVGIGVLLAIVFTPRYETSWILEDSPGAIFLPGFAIGCLFWMLGSSEAEKAFLNADKKYFTRAGVTADQYREHVENEIKLDCSLRFTEIPINGQETMFFHSEDARQSAYKEFEKAALEQFHLDDLAYKNRAYVARYFGL